MEGKLGGEGGAEERGSECEYLNRKVLVARCQWRANYQAVRGYLPAEIRAVPWKLRDVIVASALFVPAGVGGKPRIGLCTGADVAWSRMRY